MRVVKISSLMLGLVAALMCVCAPTATAAGVHAPPAKGPTIAVKPAKPYVGDPVKLKGTLPGEVRRTVRLQRWNGKAFVTRASKASNAKGRYKFTVTATAKAHRYRVVAPATKRPSRLKAVRTRPATVRSRPQTATISVRGPAYAGHVFAATVTVARAIAGRKVKLQHRVDGTWRAIGSAKTSKRGEATFTAPPTLSGPNRYRAVVKKTGSRPAFTSKVHTISIAKSLVPTLDITTDGGEEITSKEDYVHATMTLDPLDSGLPPFSVTTRLRVRGNSTSWIKIKLPYKVKLDSKTSLAGMPASKDWALLANFYDRSMLRNEAAFEAARIIGMPWAPRTQWVEVTVNGTFAGLYQLSETVTAAPTRVHLPSDGVLLEADSLADDDPHFTTAMGVQVFLKDPDDEPPSFTDEVALQVQAVEDSFYAEDFKDPDLGYRAHVDVDSFVDWYLVNELMKSIDSPIKNSVWMSLVDGRLAMAAPWDFDQSSGNRTTFGLDDPTGWYVGRNWSADWIFISQVRDPRGHWLIRMLEDPWFRQQVAARWAQASPGLHGLSEHVARQAESIQSASQRNFAPVDEGGAGQPIGPTFLDEPPHHVFQGSWPAEATSLQDWLTQRIAWMDQQYGVN